MVYGLLRVIPLGLITANICGSGDYHHAALSNNSSVPTQCELTSKTESTTSFHRVESKLNFDSKSYCSLYKDLKSPENSENMENFISHKELLIFNDAERVPSPVFKHSLSTTYNNISSVKNLEMQSSSIRPLDKRMYPHGGGGGGSKTPLFIILKINRKGSVWTTRGFSNSPFFYPSF